MARAIESLPTIDQALDERRRKRSSKLRILILDLFLHS